MFDRRKAQNWEFDRTEFKYNYRAEVLPEPRPVTRDVFGRVTHLTVTQTKRVEEMPTHPSILRKPRWEISTQLSDKEASRSLARQRASDLRHTRKMLENMPGYISPQEREVYHMRELRRRREARAAATQTLQEMVDEAAFALRDEGSVELPLELREMDSITSDDMKDVREPGSPTPPSPTRENRNLENDEEDSSSEEEDDYGMAGMW